MVVGGGIYGAAAAWDASQRGLSVALVERDDFGGGASWNSLKTIHGGMRYLQKAALGRLRESARERRTLLAIAPDLVRPLPFVVPTYGHGLAGREALAVALRVSNWLTRDRNDGLPQSARIPGGRTVSSREAVALVPGLDPRGLTGAGLWSDAQVSSTERLTLGFVLAASAAGARVANHAEVVELLRARGRVAGVAVRDTLSGGTLELRSRLVLNAAGPWCDELLARGAPGAHRRPCCGHATSSWTVRRRSRSRWGPEAPAAFSSSCRGRAGPWWGPTTSRRKCRPAIPGISSPRPRRAFPWAPLADAQLTLVHEGLVPGKEGAAGLSTRPRLHDHEVEDGLPGLVSLQGVKYTTARVVAERSVDLALRRLGRPFVPGRTALTVLPSARALAGDLESRTREAVREEMALTLADAVLRRLDLGTAASPRATDLDVVCEVMAGELGWDAERRRVEREALARIYPAP